MDTVQDIREQFSALKPGVGPDDMIEIIGASFIADEPSIFGTPNQDYIRRELAWYASLDRSLDAMEPPVPKIWERVSDDNRQVNSHYGYLIDSGENHYQYERVLDELLRDRESRRAVMIYTRPSMHVDAVANGMDDFVCTNVVQYMVRGGELCVVVQMRSNDAVFGYNNDWPWQKHVQHRLARDLDVEPGPITWQVGSLHVYPRHHRLVP